MKVKNIIEALLAKTNIPFTERRWNEYKDRSIPSPPYIVWFVEVEEGFGADEKVLAKQSTVTVELYADTRDYESEEVVEDVIAPYEWTKYIGEIEDESLIYVSYTFDLYTKKGENITELPDGSTESGYIRSISHMSASDPNEDFTSVNHDEKYAGCMIYQSEDGKVIYLYDYGGFYIPFVFTKYVAQAKNE